MLETGINKAMGMGTPMMVLVSLKKGEREISTEIHIYFFGFVFLRRGLTM